MTLTCGCNFDIDDCAWWYEYPNDFSTHTGKRKATCKSCGKKVNIEEECVKLRRYRQPRCDLEWRIYGDELPLASWTYCMDCGEILMNLVAYGYCVDTEQNMKEQLQEHWELTGFTPQGVAT